jgi:hypothetical protein
LKETIYEQIKKYFMCAVKVTVKSIKELSEARSTYDTDSERGWNLNYYYESNDIYDTNYNYVTNIHHPIEIGCYTYRPILSDGDLEIVSDKSTD